MKLSFSQRLLVGTFKGVNSVIAWHRLPKWIGTLNLVAFRHELRAKNLTDLTLLTIIRATGKPVLSTIPGTIRYETRMANSTTSKSRLWAVLVCAWAGMCRASIPQPQP